MAVAGNKRWILIIAVLSACGAPREDRCRPRPLVVTGDIAQDLLGTWGWCGIDTPVVIRFRPDGGWNDIELTTGGSTVLRQYRWFVLDAGVADVEFHGEVSVEADAGLVGHLLSKQPLSCTGLDP